MAQQWKCPSCGTPIQYDDYTRVLHSDRRPYACRKCGIALAVDKVVDELIVAPPRPAEPRRKRR
jgi:hypothetical protein